MNGEYFESAELSDIGRKRKNNEDACLRIAGHDIFCVADGMGGQSGGDIASETIVTTLQEAFSKISPEYDNTLKKRVAFFREATNRASKWIKDFADEKVVGQMGSTLVALIIDPRNPRRAVGMHAGDSRLYRYRNGEFKQITADHSAVNAMAAKLGIPVEKVPAKYQNELLRAVGLTEAVELEKTPVDINSGDIFLICSDGLCKMVPDSAIAKIIKEAMPSGVQAIAQKLVNAANEAGGKDNCTVVIVRALDLATAPTTTEGDDEEKTPIPPADLLAKISPPTPVPAAETPRGGDSDDIRGDTPQTPVTSDSMEKKDGETKAPVEKVANPVTPVSQESPTHFITRSDVKASQTMSAPTVSSPTVVAGKETPPKPEKPEKKSGPPIGLIIGIIVAVAAIAGGIWFAVQSKSNSPPSGASETATNAPAKQASTTPTPPPPAPAPSQNTGPSQAQVAYNSAIKSAQDAWGHGDYKDAASYAATALQQIPGDATATKLANDAQAQLKVQDSWRAAFVNGRNAYNSGDYKNALAWANEALKYMPGEKTAIQLRDSAQQKLSGEEKYQAAKRDGEAALKNDDLNTANQKAQEMLAIRPNDPAAQEIIRQSGQMMDYESAHRAFDEADYDYALQICQGYSSAAQFQQLAQRCQSEQATLNSDKSLLASGDYSFVSSLQGQSLARKAPFAKLLAQAAHEQQILSQLQQLKDSSNWQAVAKILADSANAPLLNKTPFQAMNQWAKSSSASVQNQKDLQQASVTFEDMLVWFNIMRPGDHYLQSAEAKQQSRYDGQLTETQRQQYLTTIAQLQTVFASNGVLNQKNRAKLLKELEDTVSHHE